jgi:hypothetical protein
MRMHGCSSDFRKEQPSLVRQQITLHTRPNRTPKRTPFAAFSFLSRNRVISVLRTMRTTAGRPQAMPGTGLPRCPTGLRPAVRTCSTVWLQKFKQERDARRVECEAHAQHPPNVGLITDSPEKDACGVGFVGELTKEPSRKCVTDALSMLVRMTHRGACGCEENTGTQAALRSQV